MKFVHLLNAALWMLNAICWAFVAHSVFFTVVSAAGVGLSLYMAYSAHNDYWSALNARTRRASRYER